MVWILSSFLFILYYFSAGLTQTSTSPQVVLHPESRLIPVGAEALFTCKFRSVINPYWEINGIQATNNFNKIRFRNQGFFIDQEQTNDDGSVVLTMRVNGSYPRLHNSRIKCKTFTEGINSETATLLIIEELPIPSNPLVEQQNAISLHLKWSPPFLWPGYLIKSYNITIRNNRDESINNYQVNSTSFSNAVVEFQFSPWHQHCTNFKFEITPMHHQVANQVYNVTGGYLSALGFLNISAITFFRADETPLVRVLVKPSHEICNYQELNIAINITDRATNALVTEVGPLPHRGNASFEYYIALSNLKREMEYLMTVTIHTGFESSTISRSFNSSLIINEPPPTTAPMGTISDSPSVGGDSSSSAPIIVGPLFGGIVAVLAMLLLASIIVTVTVIAVAYRQQKLQHNNQEIPQAAAYEEPYDWAVSRLPQTEPVVEECSAYAVLTT